MNWLRNNLIDIFTLLGFVFLNIPAYMYNTKIGLCVTGASFLFLAIIMMPTPGEGGD